MYELLAEENPIALQSNEYEFFAWIFQMILYSEATEKLADVLSRYNYFMLNPRGLKYLFDEEIRSLNDYYVISARRDIEIGEIITNVMVEKIQMQYNNAVNWNDKNKILSHRARCLIKKGSIITKEQIISEYENK